MRNDKKLLGQYFTDPTVAMFMAQLVLDSCCGAWYFFAMYGKN